ncbi:hypothetical protein [Microvirga subterranea]|uniref:Uncharacterized protein n=1 Tax=Microvirga subterranea TaxID=186651 RepID=A0A370HTM2_9HYPH|nr:hypothetical protein [Microvirga subterranea]RDI61868.1 hypothetical protein DES45_101126 [Microvirga subterranea]
MALSDIFSRLNPRKRRADKAREELKANAEKALRMKQEAETGAHIPPHRTANEGMRDHSSNEDHIPAREGYFTPELKRTKVARSGDAS